MKKVNLSRFAQVNSLLCMALQVIADNPCSTSMERQGVMDKLWPLFMSCRYPIVPLYCGKCFTDSGGVSQLIVDYIGSCHDLSCKISDGNCVFSSIECYELSTEEELRMRAIDLESSLVK